MLRPISIYGLVSGAIVSLMLVLSFAGSIALSNYGELFGFATMIIAFAFIIVAVKNQRDKINEGSITFGKAFLVGLGVTVVASIMYTITWMIVSATIAQDFMELYNQKIIDDMQSKGASLSEIADKKEALKHHAELYKNPLVKIAFTFIEIFPVGVLVSLIVAFIMKRKTTN